MQRYRFRVPQNEWGSTLSKYNPSDTHVGVDDFTADSKNFETEINGSLQKRRGDTNYEMASSSGTIKDLYEAVFVDGTHHSLRLRSGTLEYSSGNGVYNSVTGSPSYSSVGNFEFANYLDRIYFGNGIDQPQVYDKIASYGGVSYTVPKTKDMGAQAPTTAPTAAVGGAGNVPAGTYQYEVTFLYYDFEESNGGLASNVVSPGVASQINLTSVPVGGYGVTARKVYRTNDGGLTYRLVGTIANNTATIFTDDAATATEFIPLDNGTPRNFTLIAQHQDRLWIAGIPGDRSEIDYSAAIAPDIWPSTNTVFCEPGDPVTGMVVYNGRLVVFNRNSFGQILGTSPDTYRYTKVPGRVGCVDNRTIQVRVVEGVPILIWLSSVGFYAYNGSSVNYLSDDIEDLLKFNIQQAAQVKGSNSQSTFSDFSAGYFVTNGGIDVTSNPGTVTVVNPKSTFDEQSEWQGGSSTSAIVTQRSDIANSLAMAKQKSFVRTEGTNSGTVITGGNLELPTFADYTGESLGAFTGSVGASVTSGTQRYFFYTKTLPRAGTLTQITARVRRPAGSGSAILVLFNTADETFATAYSPSFVVSTSFTTITWNTSISLAPGTYKFGVETVSSSFEIDSVPGKPVSAGLTAQSGFNFSGAADPRGVSSISAITTNIALGYTFLQTAVPTAGNWTSTIHDTGLYPQAGSIVATVNHSTTYPAGTGATTYVDEADNLLFTIGVTTLSTLNLNGSSALTFTPTKRFWRIRISLTASDDRVTPSVTTDPYVQWPTTVTWISSSIDNTLGISSLDTLVATVGLLPSGTTLTATIQKSTLIGGPFTDEGSFALILGTNTVSLATVTNPLQRFTRLKMVFVNSSTPTATPELTALTLEWTITTNFYSQVIDTGAAPAGWDIFQSSFVTNSGGVTFGMRSATTAIQLTDDVPSGPFVPAFITVTNGSFPTTVPLNQFAQFCTTLVAMADQVPVIDSVTINWFISLVNSIRAASIFVDKEYYCSLATYNSTSNNILLKFDRSGKWRIWRDQSVGTLSYFFDDVFFGDGAVAIVRKFLAGTTDHGNAIALDVRLKAFDFETQTKLKVLRQVFVVVNNTGATYTISYSLDEGNTYQPLVDAAGVTSFTVPTNSGQTSKRMVPLASYANQGKSILVKIQEGTTNEASIQEVQLDAYVREGDLING